MEHWLRASIRRRPDLFHVDCETSRLQQDTKVGCFSARIPLSSNIINESTNVLDSMSRVYLCFVRLRDKLDYTSASSHYRICRSRSFLGIPFSFLVTSDGIQVSLVCTVPLRYFQNLCCMSIPCSVFCRGQDGQDQCFQS